MQNNLDYEKGGKYPQKFQEKLAKASLNTDAISSMVLQDKKIAEASNTGCRVYRQLVFLRLQIRGNKYSRIQIANDWF